MKALSILQPWAALIVAGVKDIENRSWPTQVRGEILVHAGKGFDMQAYMWLKNNFLHMGLPAADACKVGDLLDRMNPKSMERGGIVGSTEIIDCVRHHPSPWKAEDSHGFVLRNSKPLPFRPLRGQLGFFEVAEDQARACQHSRHRCINDNPLYDRMECLDCGERWDVEIPE